MGKVLSSIPNAAKTTNPMTTRSCVQRAWGARQQPGMPFIENLHVLGRDLSGFWWSQQPYDLGPAEDISIGLMDAWLSSGLWLSFGLRPKTTESALKCLWFELLKPSPFCPTFSLTD